jgi:hypothetical protein
MLYINDFHNQSIKEQFEFLCSKNDSSKLNFWFSKLNRLDINFITNMYNNQNFFLNLCFNNKLNIATWILYNDYFTEINQNTLSQIFEECLFKGLKDTCEWLSYEFSKKHSIVY